MISLARILGLTGYNDPRGVRAEFCDHCLTIGPHWVFDLTETGSAKDAKTAVPGAKPASNIFQVCQICSAKTGLTSAPIMMGRAAADEVEIEQLIDRTHPELWEEESIERIQQQLRQFDSGESRKQLAMTAFAYGQQDLANDLLRLADVRIWGILFLCVPLSFKLFRKAGWTIVWVLSAVIPFVVAYRFWIVPRHVRSSLEPAWIRLLTGSGINYRELSSFIANERGRFPNAYWLMRSKRIKRLAEETQLHRDPAALEAGVDFLPPPKAWPGTRTK